MPQNSNFQFVSQIWGQWHFLWSLQALLEQDLFHRSLLACCLEIVLFAYSSPRTFPWIIEVLDLRPFYFYKVNKHWLTTGSVLKMASYWIQSHRGWCSSSLGSQVGQGLCIRPVLNAGCPEMYYLEGVMPKRKLKNKEKAPFCKWYWYVTYCWSTSTKLKPSSIYFVDIYIYWLHCSSEIEDTDLKNCLWLLLLTIGLFC